MRIAAQTKDVFVLSVERGEELFASIKKFLGDKKITAGYFSGLGAADELELAYYNLQTREYERHEVKEEVEILTLQGNIAWKGEELILHIHGAFGRRDLSTFGGHLFRLRVSGVCELHFTALPGEMTRAFDKATGLNTLCSLSAGSL